MKKITSVILAFCILNLFNGCYTTKSLSINEASAIIDKEDFLAIKTQDGNYELHNYHFLNDCLEGDLCIRTKGFEQYILVTAEFDHVFITQEKPSVFISIPNENIKKITCHKIDGLSTAGLVAGVTVAIIGGVYLFLLSMMASSITLF